MYNIRKIVLLIVLIGLFIAPASADLMIGNTPYYAAYTGGTYNGVDPQNITDRIFTTSDIATFYCNAGQECLGGKANAVVQDFTYPYRLQNITIKFEVTGTQGYSSPILYVGILNYQTGLWENTYIQEVTVGNIYNGTTFYNGTKIARYVRIYVTFTQAASSGGQNYKNYELQVYGDQTYDELTITSPVNQSVNQSRAQVLSWRSSLNDAPYTVNTSLNANMTQNTTVAMVSSYTSYDGAYYYWSTPTLYFLPNTTYYWQPKDIFNNNVTGNFTTIYEPPGALNVIVLDEQTRTQVNTFTTDIYDLNKNKITKSTDYGWTNFTSTEAPYYYFGSILTNQYTITVTPDSNISSYTETILTDNTSNTYLVTTGSGYSPRTIIGSSPSTVFMYVPNLAEPNIVDLLIFELADTTGRFSYTTSYLSIYSNNTLLYRDFFDSSAKTNVWLIQGKRYYVTVTNALTGAVYSLGDYIPSISKTEIITITQFSANDSLLYPLSYNVTNNFSSYVLYWSDNKNVMNTLTFNVYNTTSYNICSYSTSANSGIYTCTTGTYETYRYTLSFKMNDGTFVNSSSSVDYASGLRINTSGTHPITGAPIGMGYNWNYGSFTMPEWFYVWGSILLLFLSLAIFTQASAALGTIITIIFALILEWMGFFRPLWDATKTQAQNLDTHYIFMGITGGLLFISLIYFLLHKDRGG